jgi:hypothetical protein
MATTAPVERSSAADLRTDAPSSGWRLADAVWAVPGAVVGALVMLAVHRGLIDDAYITLGYAREMATHLHWGLIPTETSNTATSPLNILMLTASTWLVSLVTGDVRPVVGLGLLSTVLSAALAFWSAQIARRIGVSPAWSLAVLAVVFANPFVNSAIGLEVLPIAALLTGLLAEAIHGRRVAFGLLAGLLAFVRLDLVVIVAVVYLLTPEIRRRPWVAPAVAVVPALPWYAFSWWYLGSAIPTSFVIKTLQKSFGDQTFANGLWTLWWTRGALPLLLAVVPAGIGLVAALVLVARGVGRRLPAHLWALPGLGMGGAAYFAAYSILQVPPYQWYYVPTTTALGITGVFGLALLLRSTPARRPLARAVVPLTVSALLVVLAGISLDGRSLPWRYPVYFGSWAVPEDYRTVGAAVGERIGGDTVLAPAEIGTLAYACDCSIVDPFADPGRALPLIEKRIDESGPVGRFLLELNFARLDRDVQRRPVQWRLIWTQRPVPPGVLSWPTDSPATGPATMYLQPVD